MYGLFYSEGKQQCDVLQININYKMRARPNSNKFLRNLAAKLDWQRLVQSAKWNRRRI